MPFFTLNRQFQSNFTAIHSHTLASEGWQNAWQSCPKVTRSLYWSKTRLGWASLWNVILSPSVLWHCWLGDRKGIRLVKSRVLVYCLWGFNWRFANLTACQHIHSLLFSCKQSYTTDNYNLAIAAVANLLFTASKQMPTMTQLATTCCSDNSFLAQTRLQYKWWYIKWTAVKIKITVHKSEAVMRSASN